MCYGVFRSECDHKQNYHKMYELKCMNVIGQNLSLDVQNKGDSLLSQRSAIAKDRYRKWPLIAM